MPVLTSVTMEGRPSWSLFSAFKAVHLVPGSATTVDPGIEQRVVFAVDGRLRVSSAAGRLELRRGDWLQLPQGSGAEIVSTAVAGEGELSTVLVIDGRWNETPHLGLFWAWPEQPLEDHFHDYPEYWFIVHGSSRARVEGAEAQIHEGDFVANATGTVHGITDPDETIVGISCRAAVRPGERVGHLLEGVDPVLSERP